METLLIILGGLFLIPFLLIYGAFVKALVLSKFYTWFIIPLFIDLPVFNFWQWVGIALTLQLLKSGRESIKKEYTDQTSMWTKVILGPWIVLLIGYLFHLFI